MIISGWRLKSSCRFLDAPAGCLSCEPLTRCDPVNSFGHPNNHLCPLLLTAVLRSHVRHAAPRRSRHVQSESEHKPVAINVRHLTRRLHNRNSQTVCITIRPSAASRTCQLLGRFSKSSGDPKKSGHRVVNTIRQVVLTSVESRTFGEDPRRAEVPVLRPLSGEYECSVVRVRDQFGANHRGLVPELGER